MIVGESALVIRRLARKDGSHVQAEISIKVLPDRRDSTRTRTRVARATPPRAMRRRVTLPLSESR